MKERKTGEFIIAIIANIVVLGLVNSLPFWRHLTRGVVLESWVDILWAMNLSLIVQIVGNIILAINRPFRQYAFFQVVFGAATLVSAIVFFIVFPLDFSQVAGNWLNTLARVLVIVGIAGASISILTWLVRLLRGIDG
jgi:hypothetical protein